MLLPKIYEYCATQIDQPIPILEPLIDASQIIPVFPYIQDPAEVLTIFGTLPMALIGSLGLLRLGWSD